MRINKFLKIKQYKKKKINHKTVEALRKKETSRSQVTKQLKKKARLPSKSEPLQEEDHCKDCKKGVPLFCPESKITFICCQRYKNPYLRNELDKTCAEFEKK